MKRLGRNNRVGHGWVGVIFGILCCSFVFCASPPAVQGFGTIWDYYVDINSGSDSNGGTDWSDAWQTLHYAIQQVNLGDPTDIHILHVAPGEYSVANGEAASPLSVTQSQLTVVGELGTPTILGSGGWNIGFIIASAAANFFMNNLEITEFGDTIWISGSSVTIQNCTVHHNAGAAIQAFPGSSGLTVQGGQFYDNRMGINVLGSSDVTIQDASFWAQGDDIDVSFSSNVTIQRNRIDMSNNGDGVVLVDSDGLVARNEIGWGQTALRISMFSCGNLNIENNRIHDVGSSGIEVAYFNDSPCMANPTIRHNTLAWGDRNGIRIEAASAAAAGPTIYYNVVSDFGRWWNSESAGIYNNGGSPDIDYNIVWQNRDPAIPLYQGCTAGANDKNVNPFHPAFWLGVGGECLDAIPNASGDPVTEDYYGSPRPYPTGGAFDMGAIEAQEAPPGVTLNSAAQGSDGLGLVNVNYDLIDPDSDPWGRLLVEFSVDGGTTWWQAIIAWASVGTVDNGCVQWGCNGGQVNNIPMPQNSATLAWDTRHPNNQNGPLLGTYADVRIRITADDWTIFGVPQLFGPFVVDNEAPLPPGLDPVTSPTNVSPQTISGTKDANTSIWLNGSQIVPLDALTTWTFDMPLIEGDNPISLTSKDTAGNESGAATGNIVHDTIAPAAPTLNAVTSPTNATPQTLSGAKDADSSVWLNGVQIVPLDGSTTWSYSMALAEGTNSISLTSRDAAGNESGATAGSIMLDTIAPAAPSLNAVTSPTRLTPQTIGGTKEAFSSVWLNGAQIVPLDGTTGWSYSMALLTEGSNPISLTSRDEAGNESSAALGSILLDTILPSDPKVATASIPINTPTNQTTVNLTWNPGTDSGSGVAGYSWIVDGSPSSLPAAGAPSPLPASISIGPADGSYYIHVRTADNAGNWTATYHYGPWQLDGTRPSAPTLNPVTSPTQENHQVISGNKDANTSVWLNGSEVVPLNGDTVWSYDMPLVLGTNPISLACRDAAGNESTPPTTGSILRAGENHAPVLAPIGDKLIPVGVAYTLTISATDQDATDTLTFSASGFPAGSSFNPATRTFSWPSPVEGTYPGVLFTVTDDGIPPLSDSETITIRVAPIVTVTTTLHGGRNIEDFRMVSVPVDPLNPEALAVFGQGMAHYDPTVFRLFRWKPEAGSYGEYPDVPPCDPGTGYWYIGATDRTISVQGMEVPWDEDYLIPLFPGWNQVGCPFNGHSVDWAASLIRAGADEYLVPDATAFVENQIWTYGGTTGYASSAQLEPWKAYWIHNVSDEIVQLVVQGMAAAATKTDRAQAGQTTTRSAATEKAVAVGGGIKFVLKYGKYQDSTVSLGIDPSSSVGLDPLDGMSPPPVSSDFPRLYVNHPDWAERSGAYAVDVRPMGGAPLEFPLVMEIPKAKAAKTCTLTWSGLNTLPKGKTVTLVDEQTRKSLNMRSKGSLAIKMGKDVTKYRMKVVIK